MQPLSQKRFSPKLLAAVIASLVLPAAAHAWGPHWDITRAAIAALGTNHPLISRLGPETDQLTNYCWLPDYRRVPFNAATQEFYADDYLLFPGVPIHYDHLCPEVKKTYRPYWHRAVQALRLESRENAARWIGSLLHFIQDSGSPPHALEIRGDAHSKMENWVDAKQILLGDYKPQRLGTNESDALQGLLRRMDGLIESSKEVGRRAQAPLSNGVRSAVEPIVLESALECARVTADALHTFGMLDLRANDATGMIAGRITSRTPIGLERFHAKVLLEGTTVSTLADTQGNYLFRQLPPGRYTLVAFRPGSATVRKPVTVTPDATTRCDFDLTSGESNLLRNADFTLSWVVPDKPDCWTKVQSSWEGEMIPLRNGQRYRATAEFHPGAKADVLLRWSTALPHVTPKPTTRPRIESHALTPTNSQFAFTADETMALLQVIVRTAEHPTNALKRVSLVPLNE